MARLILFPTKMIYITSKVPDKNLNNDGWLLVGQGTNSRYRSLLEFDLGPMIDDMDISKAILRIHSASGCRPCNVATVTPYYICTQWEELTATWNNQPPINQSIRGHSTRITPGWNMLDITPVVQAWSNNTGCNFGLMLKTGESCEDVIGFNVQQYRYMPSLQLFCESPKRHDHEGCFYDVYAVSNQVGYSHWKQSCYHTMYTFFVQNLGNSDVRLNIQISPDRIAVVNESAEFKISPNQTEAIAPQKFAFFTRLAFRTIAPNTAAAIRVWFQPIVGPQ